MTTRPLAIVVSGFPRRSETFAVGELLALQERGLLAAIIATKPGEPGPPQPGVERLSPFLHRLEDEPGTWNVELLSAQAVARLRGLAIGGVHAYFAHTPAAIAARVAEQLRVPFGFSMHARDARKVGPEDLRARAAAAACVVACNSDVAREVDGKARLHLVPHGVDLNRFAPRNPEPAAPNSEFGTRNLGTIRLLAVGRLVEKKGFHVLLEALAALDSRFVLRIVGEGPERGRLNTLIGDLGLASRVCLCGPATHHELPGEYGQADIVVVPSIVDATGDRDGLPNVVLEALASGRPLIASAVGAVASAVRDGETGLLVPPGDVDALRAALRSLADKRSHAGALARAGRRFVEREFDIRRCTATLADVLTEGYA